MLYAKKRERRKSRATAVARQAVAGCKSGNQDISQNRIKGNNIKTPIMR